MNLQAYDLEVFKNFFSASFKRIGEGGEENVFVVRDGYTDDIPALCRFLTEGGADKAFVGYNSKHYDSQVLLPLLYGWPMKQGMNVNEMLFARSTDIIHNNTKWNRPPYKDVDLMRVTSKGYNSRPLKLIAANLHWPTIKDLPFDPEYYVQERDIPDLLWYNMNDVGITAALFEHLREDMRMRWLIGNRYGINVMSESNSGMGLRVLEQLYRQRNGVDNWFFRSKYDYDPKVLLGDVVPDITFHNKQLRDLYELIKATTVTVGQKGVEWLVQMGETQYCVGLGGLHSVHPKPRILTPKEGEELRDMDVMSYYPFIIINRGIYPRQLGPGFVDLVRNITDTRVEAKKRGDKVTANAMKESVNSIFGRLGSDSSWLYDPVALLSVTMAGQLWLLSLADRMEQGGFPVAYANTDGLTVRIPSSRATEAEEIHKEWERETGFTLEFASFSKVILKDVNNYIAVTTEGDTKMKGSLNPFAYRQDVTKALRAPVVAKAVKEYFLNGTPVRKTVMEEEDLNHFCYAQKMDSSFKLVYRRIDPKAMRIKNEVLQKTCRFIIGKGGGYLFKVRGNKSTALIKGEQTIPANDMRALLEAYPNGVPIRHAYYIREAEATIAGFNEHQPSLFDR